MGLPILPVELIEHCISFVDDIHTLAAICQTGTLGNRAATPLLYRNVGVLGDHRRLYRLQHLCQRLFENPRLASNVRNVTQSVQENASISRHDLTLEIEHCLFECIEDKNLPSAVCEFMHLYYFSESELVLLILMLCTNLKTLELRGDGTGPRAADEPSMFKALSYIGAADDTMSNNSWEESGKAVSHNAGLYTIEKLIISGDDTLTVRTLLDFLNLPALRSIYLDSLAPLEGWNEGYVTSSVQDITIKHCRANNEDISKVLRACADLQSLTIFWETSQEAHRRADWELLSDAILELRDSLQTLHLDYHVDMMPGAAVGELKNIKVEGLDTLPFMRSLENLTIPRNALGVATGEIDQFPDMSDDETDEDSNVSQTDSSGSDGLTAESTARVLEQAPQDEEQRHPFECPIPASVRHLTILCEEADIDEDATKADMEMLLQRGHDTVTIFNCTKDRSFQMERHIGDDAAVIEEISNRKRKRTSGPYIYN